MSKTFADRLNEAIHDKFGGRGGPAAVSRQTGVSQAKLSNWRKSEVAEPHRIEAGDLVGVCTVLGIRPAWLLHGEKPKLDGAKTEDAASRAMRFELERLARAIAIVEEGLLRHRKVATSADAKAQMTAIAYASLAKGESVQRAIETVDDYLRTMGAETTTI